jgi:putative transposase
MSLGDEGSLTLTVKVRVRAEPKAFRELLSLMYRYREALNHAIRVVVENKALTLGKAHRLLYNTLKEKYALPSKVAIDCYREAIARQHQYGVAREDLTGLVESLRKLPQGAQGLPTNT